MRNIFINDYRRKAKQATVLDNSPNDFLIDQTRVKVLNDGVTNLNLKYCEGITDVSMLKGVVPNLILPDGRT